MEKRMETTIYGFGFTRVLMSSCIQEDSGMGDRIPYINEL